MDVKKSLAEKGKSSLDDNLIIHGDNLAALKALLPRYAGRINCIYIDPPYNTGNEKWLYNNNVNSPMMKEWLKGKSPVDGEDLERHDKWLCMMWPRLQLLRELLSDDGVIFISIDDNEQHRLRMVMDEIFGEENFVACLPTVMNLKGNNCTLGDEISIEKMLSGKNLPDYDTFARHLVYTASGQSPNKIRKAIGKDGFFYETPDRLFYLIYEPNRTFLLSVESALNSTRAERIAKQVKTKNKTAVVFAAHKFIGQKELTAMGIVFCGLPYGRLD